MWNKDLQFPVFHNLKTVISRRSTGALLLVIMCSLAACNIIDPNAIRNMAKELSNSRKDETSLLPQDNGFPSSLLGYTILAVETPQNTACIPAGMGRVALRASEPDVQSFLTAAAPVDYHEVLNALNQINPQLQWSLTFVGPGITFGGIASENKKWNAMMATGCVKLGPIPPSVTPTP